jgi:hypothetical protein
MVKVYADLIVKGLKTLDDVPETIRAEVERLLAVAKAEEGADDGTV